MEPEPITVVEKPKNKQIYIYIASVVVAALLTGGGVYAYQKKQADKNQTKLKDQIAELNLRIKATPVVIASATPVPSTPAPQATPVSTSTPSPTAIPAPTTVSVDATWNKYTNYNLGFSLNIPKQASIYYNCDQSTTSKLDPVRVVENGSDTYVTFTNWYSGTSAATCQKQSITLTDLTTPAVDRNVALSNIGIKIQTQTINSDAELDAMIKSTWGSGCSTGNKTEAQNGTFDVKIQGDGKDLDTTSCPVNYATAIKYSPSKQKAAHWNIGQSVVFGNPTVEEYYDHDMTTSFTFL